MLLDDLQNGQYLLKIPVAYYFANLANNMDDELNHDVLLLAAYSELNLRNLKLLILYIPQLSSNKVV